MKKRIIAIISVFHPDEFNIINIEKFIEQVDFAYICDNSPQKSSALEVLEKSEYIFNGANLGLSLAFNRVLKSYSFLNSDFIVFFDQDSVIQKGHIQTLVSEYERLEMRGIKIGCIGPNFYNVYSNRENTYIDNTYNKNVRAVDFLMTSSLLCKYDTLKNIGFWNEKIFLDLSDYDLCWRIRANGYMLFIAPSIILCHALGKGEKKIGLLRIKEGSPFRVYYQTRDCLRLIAKSYVPLKFKLRFFLMLTVRPIVYLIFLGDKRERIKYYIKGIRDFSKGIYGSL